MDNINKRLFRQRKFGHSMIMQVKSFPNQDRINVNTDLQYKNYLAALKNDFEERFETQIIALDTGLKGFDVFNLIGQGAYGEVRLARDVDGKTCAVKCMLKERVVRRGKIPNVIAEKKLLQAFRFPFVLYLLWCRKDREYLYLGLPFLPGGELFHLHSKHDHFSEDHARFYAVQVCLALEYLHYIRVVYRDLKLENLVIDNIGYIRLVDFGFSKRVEYRTMSLCGTPEYLAPEILTATPYFSGPDWWAFGVLVYEMVNGETPFTNYVVDTKLMYAQILKAEYHMPAKFSIGLKDLVKHLLVIDITKRYGCRNNGADDIKQHEWFNTINWFAYLRKEVEAPFIPELGGPLDIRYFVVPKPSKIQRKREINRNSYTEAFVDF